MQSAKLAPYPYNKIIIREKGGHHKKRELAGIYIHIPFCKQACYYCNFHFSTSLTMKAEMVSALIREIEIRTANEKFDPENATNILSKNDIIETIYFGGGTPSLLSDAEIASIISAIQKNYQVDKTAEITLEANPDDITEEKLFSWKKNGINRLSIGIQSFIDRDLKWMNRAHNADQAIKSIILVKNAGFNNYSIDLIFGVPGLSDKEWKQNIETAIELAVPHISSYALTVEPKTALNRMIQLKKKEAIDQDKQAEQYLMLMNILRSAGYEQYEISNLAKKGFRSRHNSSYWQLQKYIGIGPSAHSFNGTARMWNKPNNILYIQSLEKNILPYELEMLTETQQLNEYVMTSVRTIEGLDLQYVESRFSNKDKERILQILGEKIKKEYFNLSAEKIVLTDEGKLFADAIAAELFL